MNEQTILKFLNEKLDEIDSLKNKSTKDSSFKSWKNSLLYIMKRLGKDYGKRIESISFSPSIYFLDSNNDRLFLDSYNSGLDSARAVISSTIEEIELFGLDYDKELNASNNNGVHINVNQKITINDIDISNYDKETVDHIILLKNELNRPSVDEKKVKALIKWLLDKGTDALIAIIANSLV